MILIAAVLVFVLQVALMRSEDAANNIDKLAEELSEVMSHPERNPTIDLRYAENLSINLAAVTIVVVLFVILKYCLHPWAVRTRGAFAFRDFTKSSRLKVKWARYKQVTEDPKLAEELRVLSARAELRGPRLEIGHDWYLRTAQAFGFPPFVIRVEAGFRLLCRNNSDEARAILLHELAHIRNGDIWRGWFAAAVMEAVAVCTMLFIKSAFDIPSFSGNATHMAAQTIVLGLVTSALLFFFYSRFLRAREVYADCRAHTWGAGAALQRMLSEAVRTGSERARSILSLHPGAATRIRYLLQPELFSDVSRIDMLGLGALLGIASASVHLLYMPLLFIMGGFRPPTDITNNVMFEFALLVVTDVGFSYALMSTMGVTVQRQVTAALLDNEGKKRKWKHLGVALSLSVGFCLGSELGWLEGGTIYPFLLLFAVLVSTMFLWLVIVYVRFTTKKACERVTSEKMLRRRALLIRILGTAMLSALLPYLGYLDVPADVVSPSMRERVLRDYFILFVVVYSLLWAATLILIRVWKNRTVRCPNCYAIHKQPTFGSNCGSCSVEITRWATIEWPREIETSPKITPNSSTPVALDTDGDSESDTLSNLEERSAPVTLEIDDETARQALSSLEEEIINHFAGQSMTAARVCETFDGKHSASECLEALKLLEKAQVIIVDPDRRFRESSRIPDTAIIYFPKQKKRSLRSVGV